MDVKATEAKRCDALSIAFKKGKKQQNFHYSYWNIYLWSLKYLRIIQHMHP